MKSKKHTKKYSNDCPQCWKWQNENDAIDFMRPWLKIAEGIYNGKPYEMYECNYRKTYEFV